MKRNQLIALLVLIIGAWSCRNDDDGLLEAESIPPRTLSEVAIEDDAEIREFLQTHFYNYEEFENPPADFNFVVMFDTIAGDNAGKTPILDRPELKSVVNSKSENIQDVYDTIIAEKFMHEKKRIVSALKKYGIQSVLTEPQNLTGDTINKYLEVKARGLH